MRKILYIFLGLVLVNSLILSQGKTDEQQPVLEASLEPAHVSYVTGVVNIGHDKAEINMPITEKNTVETKNGRIEIELGRGGHLWLDKNTKILFVFLGEEAVEIRIEYGKVYLQVGTKNIDVFANQEHMLLNQKGIHRIEVKGNEVKKFDQLEIVDNFDSFVAKRAETLTESNSEYLPEELSEHENELETNGNWRYHRVYGYVWIPVVSLNWRPYLHGRWAYYPSWGRVWISYDGPWGWVVFHFGRWQYHSNWGWYWIPRTYWSPGWVYWYSWGSYIGWCPMWYSSSYYHHYHYYYSYSYSRGWNTVHKNQLNQRRNISTSIAPKNELKRRAGNLVKLSEIKATTIQGKTQLRKQRLQLSTIKAKASPRINQKSATARIKTPLTRNINVKSRAKTIRTFPNRIRTNKTRSKITARSSVIRKKLNTRVSSRKYIPRTSRISKTTSRSRINSIRRKIGSAKINSIRRSTSKKTAIRRSTTRRVTKKRKK